MAVVIVCAASGCYFSYPKIPTRPKVIEGERVELDAQKHSYTKTCSPKDPNCGLSNSGQWQKRASYTNVVATYHGQHLTQFELRSLVDPKFDEKIEHIRSRKTLCNLSLIPSVIGIVGMGVAIIGLGSKDRLGEDRAKVVTWVGVAAGAGGGLGSWALGGFACTKAKEEYQALFPGVAPDDRQFEVDRRNAEYVREMKTLTEAFNQRFRNGPPQDTPEETTEEASSSE